MGGANPPTAIAFSGDGHRTQQETPVEQALAYTLEVLISLREAAIDASSERMVSHEKCLAEIIDSFVKENDPNEEITRKVYVAMHKAKHKVS